MNVFSCIPLADPFDYCFSCWNHCLQALSFPGVLLKVVPARQWNGGPPQVPDSADGHVSDRLPHQLCCHYDSQHGLWKSGNPDHWLWYAAALPQVETWGKIARKNSIYMYSRYYRRWTPVPHLSEFSHKVTWYHLEIFQYRFSQYQRNMILSPLPEKALHRQHERSIVYSFVLVKHTKQRKLLQQPSFMKTDQ